LRTNLSNAAHNDAWRFLEELSMTISRRTALTAGAAAFTLPSLTGLPAARAAAPKVGKQAPGYYRFNVGDIEVTALHDGHTMFDINAQRFPNAPDADLKALLSSQFMPTEKGVSPFNTVIVNTGSKLILIDAGFNNNGAPTTGKMVENMAAAGIDAKQVDTVLISHFHPDHINGLRSKEGALVYPNAEIIVPGKDVAHYMDDAKMNATPEAARGAFLVSRRVFAPIMKDVKQAEWGKEWAPGVNAIQSDGHTPGHTSFVVSSGGKSLLIIGDASNDPRVFAKRPDWHLGFDMDKAQAVASRKKLLDMAAADRMQVSFYHAAFPATGFIAKAGAGYDWHPMSYSAAL
jgi:glyoxylase-like metal-dependent hydrolase (beta-lactamase superfamily II)